MRAAVLASLVVASTVHAFVGAHEQPLRPARVVVAARDLSSGWQGLRDRTTGVIARMWGAPLAVPGSLHDPAIAERAARAFVAGHMTELAPGSAPGDLVLVANRLDGKLRTVAFEQRWRGLRVVGGQVHVVFARDRLFAAGSDAWPRVAATLPGLPAFGERVVLPIVANGAISYRVVDRTSDGVSDSYTAPDGSVLARTSRARTATGTLQLDVADRHPGGPRSAVATPGLELVADGVATTTDDAGLFGWAGSAPAQVTPSVVGPRIRITNAAGAPVTAALVAQPDQPVVWSAAATELDDAQLSAFSYATLAKARARQIAPGLPFLDQPLAIHVNEPDTCNAFSTGDDLHFFVASPMCENTARLADVVLHEFGHSFHNHVLIPGAGVFEAALAEGVADFFAANITGDPGVGRGFFHDDSVVRDLDPVGREAVFPRDATFDPHITGLIIGGALWDLRTAIGVVPTESIYRGVLERASDITTAFAAALVADDDDGDLGNGTPHACAIEAAFGRHGIAGPEFRTTTLSPPIVDGLALAVAVDTPAAAPCPKPQVTAMTIEWRTAAGAPQSVAMAPDGATWRGAIPAQPDGTVVLYTVHAQLDDGTQVVFPDNPADPEYQLFSGGGHEIWCERFDGADPRWAVTGSPAWQIGAPTSDADAPAAFSGTAVLGNGLDAYGRYRGDTDSAIRTPFIDASPYDRVHLQFRRWLSVEDAKFDRVTVAVNGMTIWQNASSPAGDLDHIDREWRFVDLEVPPAMTSIVWTLTADDSLDFGGWNIDDVCLVGVGKHAVCGDGVLDDGEQCDRSDGCSLDCTIEDTGCCSAGDDPAGALALALGLLVVLRRRREPLL